MGRREMGEKLRKKNEWFWNRLYSLQQLNMRIFLVFNYMILIWSIILFGNKKNLIIGIILSVETIVFENFI
jgi:hypothetical protein